MTYAGSLTLNWTFSDTDPAHWVLQEATVGMQDWGFSALILGSLRTVVISDVPRDYRLVGLDVGNHQIYEPSNTATALS